MTRAAVLPEDRAAAGKLVRIALGESEGSFVSTQAILQRVRILAPTLDLPDVELVNMIARTALDLGLGVHFEPASDSSALTDKRKAGQGGRLE